MLAPFPWARLRATCPRSGLEVDVLADLHARRVRALYEQLKIKYIVPEKSHLYLPDIILSNGIVIEVKGPFDTSDRTKHRLIHEQLPDLDLRFVFGNPHRTIGGKSKTTYALWCDRLGIPWAHRRVPQEWVEEPFSQAKWDAINQCRYGDMPDLGPFKQA